MKTTRFFAAAALACAAAFTLSGCGTLGQPAQLAPVIDSLAHAGCTGNLHFGIGAGSAAGLSPGAFHVENTFDGACRSTERARSRGDVASGRASRSGSVGGREVVRAVNRLTLASLALAGAALAGCATHPAARPPERFSGKLYVVLLDDKDHPSTRAGRSTWGLERPLTYRTSIGGTDTITVPPGFVTDLASIPAAASPFLPPDGPWTKAAIVHDFLYDTHGACVWKGHLSGCSRSTPYSRAEADDILREAMADRGISDWRAWAIHTGVRVGGGKGWGS